MSQKKDKEYFLQLENKDFRDFMIAYSGLIHEYVNMLNKAMYAIDKGENPSKNHCYKMRGKTMDLEKFGKKFRERTILMDKVE